MNSNRWPRLRAARIRLVFSVLGGGRDERDATGEGAFFLKTDDLFLKTDDFLLENDDFLLENDDFLLENVDL